MKVRRAAFCVEFELLPNMQKCVAFKSNSFNTEAPREYFINPGCFGDDVALWLISELRARGYSTDAQPAQEDFGWYFTFQVEGSAHQAVIGYRPEADNGDWLCFIERKAGVLGSLIGTRKDIEPAAVEVIHKILASSPKVSAVRIGSEDEI